MGHAVGALSRIRRDNIKPTLNPVYYSLCNRADDPVPHSPLLFGDDLDKQVRDAKETSNISQPLALAETGNLGTIASHIATIIVSAILVNREATNLNIGPTTSLIFWEGPEKTDVQSQTRQEILSTLENIKLSVSKFPLAIKNLTNYLKLRCGSFKAGNVRNSLSAWQNLTSDPEILSTVTGTIIEFDTPPITKGSPKIPFSIRESDIIDQEIAKMLAKGIVEVATHTSGEVVSNIFIRPKKDGSHRLILNLKGLNQFVSYHNFKMDTLHSILKLIERGCFMASLDLKDAYYSVSVNHSDRKYLRFCLARGSISVYMFAKRALKLPTDIYQIIETSFDYPPQIGPYHC